MWYNGMNEGNRRRQREWYARRIGTIYGDFEVADVVYDDVARQQVWTLRCTKCGSTRITRNGEDYRKGRNKGVCKACLHGGRAISNFVPQSTLRKRKHGLSSSRIYSIWRGMIYRCENESATNYKYYGLRGISVCEEWHDVETFCEWALSNGYSDDLTIDRIDNDGNYEPSNCRWVTYRRQSNNRRFKKYEIDGVERTLLEWCTKYCIYPQTVRYRMNVKGMSLKDALTKGRYSDIDMSYLETRKHRF